MDALKDAEIGAQTSRLRRAAWRSVQNGSALLRPQDLRAEGEAWSWLMGGALALGVAMILGLLALVLYNGILTFWPYPIEVVTLRDGTRIAGVPVRQESYRPDPSVLAGLPQPLRQSVEEQDGVATRTLYRTGNFDLYGDDFRWVPEFDKVAAALPREMVLVERQEWGVFIGRIAAFVEGGRRNETTNPKTPELARAHAEAREIWSRIRRIERIEIGTINHRLEAERLRLRRVMLRNPSTEELERAHERYRREEARLKQEYEQLAAEAQRLRRTLTENTITFVEIGGREVTMPLAFVVRLVPGNDLSFGEKLRIYLSRWWEFLSDEPREANTEGGVMPAIFGTFVMTVLLSIVVAPFGVITALYLREYARQGRVIATVRVSVNNLAGVPSIVYGVFGLGFFAYIVGGTIDQLFFPERLPTPTFGTGGILWSSLTLALLTVPVVIVATEEALAAVPRSLREGSLACGASKWQTIRYIVLPQALPGVMTGLILAMARGAGEVAPLMLVGVVKLAPELPVDGFFPFIHLERSFMHLGFHIFDVGFQSRNSEAGKPMVFVTTLLLLVLIFVMNIGAILLRNRLKRRFQGSQF